MLDAMDEKRRGGKEKEKEKGERRKEKGERRKEKGDNAKDERTAAGTCRVFESVSGYEWRIFKAGFRLIRIHRIRCEDHAYQLSLSSNSAVQ